MKCSWMALAAVGVSLLWATEGPAQDILRAPADDLYYFAQQEASKPSPSDAAVPDAAACRAACNDPCCDADKPWELFPETCRGLKIGGWVQFGYHTEGTNGDGTGMFNNYPNHAQLQQSWLYLEKAVDNGGCGWDWGFRFDYVYGTDGQDTQAFGGRPYDWDNGWDEGGYYGHAIPQLYAEVAYNNLKAKLGHFYTIIGYEVVPATGNFFYSHSFMMVNAEPFTHSGVLLEYGLGDCVTLYGGWTAGWDTGFTRNGGAIFLGGIKVQLTEDVSLTYATTMGDFGFDPPAGSGSDSNGYSHSVVVDVQLTDRLTYVFQHDYLDNDVFMGGADDLDKAWGISNYLFYDFNDCWAAGLRYEYFASEHNVAPPWAGTPAPHVNALTLGMNWKPHPNFRMRPEVRWEWFDADTRRTDQCLFGIDAILTFY
jgi:hypothetical protein